MVIISSEAVLQGLVEDFRTFEWVKMVKYADLVYKSTQEYLNARPRIAFIILND